MNLKLTTTLILAATLSAIGCNTGSHKSSTSSSTTAPSTSTTTGATTSGSTSPTGSAAVSAGNFSAGPDLLAGRGQHSATVLDDGRVLVVGGTDGQGIISDSEVFDPLTNTWDYARNLAATPDQGLMMDPTGQFPTARQLHTASKLPNGMVLVAGGLGVERLDMTQTPPAPVFETLTTAYLFNPVTNAFTRTANLSAARGWHEAGVVTAGASSSVVLVGGMDANLNSIASGDVYDAVAGTFTLQGMIGFHTWGSVVSLGSDLVILAGGDVQAQQGGGFGIVGVPNPRSEMFTAGAFAAGQNNVGDRFFMAANALGNGNALFAGGREVQNQTLVAASTTELYDAAQGAFVAGPALQTARFGSVMARIGTTNDQLIVGGFDNAGNMLTTAEVYMSSTSTILSATATMATPRIDFSAVTLKDGRVMVIGGTDAQNAGIAQTEFHTR